MKTGHYRLSPEWQLVGSTSKTSTGSDFLRENMARRFGEASALRIFSGYF